MKLETYLQQQGMKPSQLALAMGKSASTITRIVTGKRKPSLTLMAEIAAATKGAVTPNDFLPTDEGRA